MPGSENTDALALPRYRADKADTWSTDDTRSIVNILDAQFDTGAVTASGGASGGALNLPDEAHIHISGTTGLDQFLASAGANINSGIRKYIEFDGALVLTHHSTQLNLPTGANITTAAGDRMVLIATGGGNADVWSYMRATGGALKIADESIDSDAYVDGSIDAAHIASSAVTTAKINADAVTAAKIADDALDSEHYTDGSIDAAHLASNAVTTVKLNADAVTAAKIADDVIDSEHYVDGSIDAAHIASSAVTTVKINNDAVTLAKLAGGTDGELITWDASGDPAAVAVGTSTHVLTSNGSGAAPTFQAAAGGGKISQVAVNATAISGSTTSTSYVDTTNSSVTFTTTKGGLVAWYQLSGYNNTTSAGTYVAMQLDSETEIGISQVTQHAANQDYSYSGCYAWSSVSNASHTIDVRMRVGTGTFNIRQGRLVVMEWDD